MKKKLTFGIFLLFVLPLFAQVPIKTKADYLPLTKNYTKWLQTNHLDHFLSVYSFDEPRDSLFQLYLKFEVSYDSVPMYWTAIDKKLKNERGYGLDKLLYFAGLNTFRIPPDNFNIIIFDSYTDVAQDTVALYYNAADKKMETDLRLYVAKGESATKKIKIGNQADKKTLISVDKFDKTRIQVYSDILSFLKAYYKPLIKGDFSDNFTVFKDEEDEELYILVTDLRNQILEKEANPWIIELTNSFFDLNIDWKRVEGIELKIKANYLNQEKINLEVEVEAKYGSGIWDVTDWDNMENFEPEFETEVKKYATKIATEIKDELKK